MESKRNTKEIKIKDIEPFKGVYGTFYKNNPIVIYVKIKSKIIPSVKQVSYIKEITTLKNKVNIFINDELKNTEWINKNYLYNSELTEKNIAYNKRSNLKYEFFIKPNECVDIEIYENKIIDIVKHINNFIINSLDEAKMKH